MTAAVVPHDSERAAGAHPDDGARVSAKERRAKGKALHTDVPRTSHAGWKPWPQRSVPVDLLVASNAGRVPELIPIRFGHISASRFAFYRGSAALMAADMAATPISGLRAQACGDTHLMNSGGFATPERNLVFDTNGFDETQPAPFEWDLKRLAASVVVAAQHLQLPGSELIDPAELDKRPFWWHLGVQVSRLAAPVL